MSIELETLESLQNETTAVQVLNVNFDRIVEYLDKTLKRVSGETPNYLEVSLDFNGKRGYNVGTPQSGTDIARWVDVTEAKALQGLVVPDPYGNDGKVLTAFGGSLVYYDLSDLPGLGDMRGENNLSELTNPASARTELGLGTIAVEDAADYAKLSDNVTWSGGATFSGTTSYRVTSNPPAPNLDDIGWRVPPFDVVNINYAFLLTDLGRTKAHTSSTAHAFTISPEGTTAYPNGYRVDVINSGTGALTITRGSGVALRKLGSSTNADVTLAQHQGVTLLKYGTNSWYAIGVAT